MNFEHALIVSGSQGGRFPTVTQDQIWPVKTCKGPSRTGREKTCFVRIFETTSPGSDFIIEIWRDMSSFFHLCNIYAHCMGRGCILPMITRINLTVNVVLSVYNCNQHLFITKGWQTPHFSPRVNQKHASFSLNKPDVGFFFQMVSTEPSSRRT